MSIVSKVTGLIRGNDAPAPPENALDLPPATIAYTLGARTDGDHDVFDGIVLVGTLSKVEGDGDRLTTWKVHVRGVDASFDTLEEAEAWLARSQISVKASQKPLSGAMQPGDAKP